MIHVLENAIRDLVVPMQIVIMQSVQIHVFVIIRHGHELPILNNYLCRGYSISFTLGWLSLLHFGALIPKSTSQILKSWKKSLRFSSQHEKKVWNKVMKSIKPLCIKAGDFYLVKHITVLNTASQFIRGTIRLLVAIKRN